jgi:hypothetical protein
MLLRKWYKGADGASGTFTNGKSSIGIDSGILLTSGQAKDAEGPNGNGGVDEVFRGFDANDELKRGASTENFFSGDSDLDTLIPQNSATQDATSLEIEFESAGGDVFLTTPSLLRSILILKVLSLTMFLAFS